ncbi:MAG TPA: RagB/SusD family nutrient uptake outer membrane protein [Longimicrobiaceae bacterium]|nr:RagB/SusD family nutrient uptake outer membrane protein [Longimicrobiaceae bacterium]
MQKPTWRRPRGARTHLAAAALACAALAAGCSLDLTNPNAPPEQAVITSVDGIITLGVGLQAQYADNVNIFLRAPSLVTDEWGTRPIALAADVSLVSGTPDPTFGVVADPFAAGYRIARTADILVANAPNVGLGSGLQAGILSMSRLFKAMALGNLALQYERLPANAGEGALPLPRAQVLDSVIALLEQARADVAGVSDADLQGFRTRVLGTGFDLRNTIDAMLARYYLFRGKYTEALAAAQRVNLNVLSVLAYPNPGLNPIYNYSAVSRYTGARKVLFTEADPADKRPAYWALRTAGSVGTPDSVFDFKKYGGRNDSYPVYLPDEMRLIMAEVYVRQGNFPAARTLINAVHTQTSSPVDEPLAGMPAIPDASLATEAQLMAQILYERRFELYAQGLRWEDLRRLAAYTAKRPSIQFLPYPQSECDVNPANPCG